MLFISRRYQENFITINLFGFLKRTSSFQSYEDDDELLRSELFSIEKLKRHAISLAGKHKIGAWHKPDTLLSRLSDNERVLLVTYDLITSAATSGQRILPAESWLLDNFYLIEQQISQARNHLPSAYCKQLPKLIDGVSMGSPRIYNLALELISHMDGRVDSENAIQFLAAYQTIEPLKLGELWAFPIMLQLALLENLRRVAIRIARRREERDTAINWADRMLATAEKEPKQLIQLLAEFANADVPLTAPFVEEFYARLQTQGRMMAFVQTWLENKLYEQGVTATQLSAISGQAAATNQISIANSIGSLRFINAMNWMDYVESLSVVEQTLCEDPAAMYSGQDFASRDRCRHVIEDMARNSDCNELVVAKKAIEFAQKAAHDINSNDRSAHVGFYLMDQGRLSLETALNYRVPIRLRISRLLAHYRLPLYLSPILLLTTLMTWMMLYVANPTREVFWFFAITGIISLSAIAVSLLNQMVTVFIPPRALQRMDFSQGIPDKHRTMVIVPTLLSKPQDIDVLIEALEIRYLGNRDPNLYFALLTDFSDALEATQPGDENLITQTQNAIEILNLSYAEDRKNIFYLFHRPRLWNPYEKVWMGYERKRGKLEQFNALLRGGSRAAFSKIVGDVDILGSIKYVITLDTDTQLPRDSAQTLIGNMAHPLNRPVFDEKLKRIVEGYAILQPRASISLTSAGQSRFTKLFVGESGIDPYSRQVSDVYQDIFAEGSFIGKGIYDVDAFRQAVDGRFPENLILSHDLIEGGYARSALVSDVELIEEHPASYSIDTSRRHRWIRGDWQLIGWLLPTVPSPSTLDNAESRRQKNPLSALSWWKIFDNLRRSLVSPALLTLLIGGLLLEPNSILLWILLVLCIVFLPSILGVTLELVRKPKDRDWLTHLNLSSQSARRPLTLSLLTLIMLPYETQIHLDAILRSAIRMLFTRRGLLLWQLPSYARRNSCHTLANFFREMWVSPALVFLLGFTLWQMDFSQWVFWAPILFLWLLAPVVAWWISIPISAYEADLSEEQRLFLRVAARRTWRYFSDFVGPNDNWLPPDNFQEYPVELIASRTSPTNIGMGLLANQAAYDFGYITASEFLQLTENTLTAMEKLERYRGHFYNWYDTQTLQPLLPQYISSVDSGNLVGCLLTLQAGLDELKEQPIVSWKSIHGLEDTLQVLAEHLSSSTHPDFAKQILSLQQILKSHANPQTINDVKTLLHEIDPTGDVLFSSLSEETDIQSELGYWSQTFVKQLHALQDDVESLLSEAYLEQIPSLSVLAKLNVSNIEFEKIESAHLMAVQQLKMIDNLMSRCRELAVMDFEFLYNDVSGLLTIGYDVGERRCDPSCYDLLASEARLASFLAIAQEQIPQKHWFALGRLLTSHGGEMSLISWSGSMFEYLMPNLIMPSYDNTLLQQTCKAAVSRQIQYGRQRAVPWGISESCYNATDMTQVYQYRAFGVPGLGLKRGLGDDLVIAPYATALALMVAPQKSCLNLQILANENFLGKYGFYEAIDYTPSRVPRGKSHAIVRSFMSHHQGMSLLAFEHVLLNQPMQRRFMSDPLMQATELLLQERVPKQGATLHPHAAEASAAAKPAVAEEGAMMRVFTNPDTASPEVHLLSNGSYHVMATHAGGGYSRWRDLAVTRWREDASADNWGTFIYIRDRDTGNYWSSAYQPTLRKADHYEAIFVQARAEYRRQDQKIETHTEISVSPEDDIEIRRLTLTNQSSRTRHIEVTSYAEIVLAPQNADLAHRSFSNLFVETEILPERQAILCTRRPRTPGEQMPWMFHLLSAPSAVTSDPSYETDRAKFIGRGRTTANPIMLDKNSPLNQPKTTLSNTEGPVLDPIAAIRRTVTLTADESATVQIVSGVADSREAALAMVEKYCDRHFVERAFEMSWFQSQEILRHLNISEADAQIYGRLASSVIYANGLRRSMPSIIARNQMGQSGLWRFAISGDLPIILLTIGDLSRIDLVKQLLQAHAYWRMKGLSSDLVIINEDFSGYRAVLHDQIIGLINTGAEVQLLDKPGGVFVRRAEELTEEDRVLFQTVARVVITDSVESLAEQVQRRISRERWPALLKPTMTETLEPKQELTKYERIFNNGLGGFTPDGHEYIINLKEGQNTPAPWVNVIASPHIGTVVSERGSAYTWVDNAHEFRLTNWYNDPVSDSSGEAIYIRDEASGVFWSPTPSPAIASKSTVSGIESDYICRHGFGYSVFENVQSGISSELYTYVSMDAPVKFLVIKLRNFSGRARQLSLTGYWELVLGEWRHTKLMHTITEIDPHSGALFARNAYGGEYANRVVFAQVSESQRSMTGNRTEFLGRNGSLTNPEAMSREHLSGRTGAGLDPCAAIQTKIDLVDGEEREIVFIFGAATSAHEAQDLIQQFSGPAGARQALENVWDHWNHTLGAVNVDTPDQGLNVLTNGWLIYQVISCRLWGRSGYYQSGGAYGFRDQLQDTLALVHTTPWLVREQIIRCAEHQFPQGDVQHWWHPPGGQGVRTQFSDDYLWLPYVTCAYVVATGDTGLLNESVHFIEGRELDSHEEAYYDLPKRSNESASVYEHCKCAIKHGLRLGKHKLPLMGCGDWNDGMNLVGHKGQGESVWLAWFLYENLESFSKLASRVNDGEFASFCTDKSAQLLISIEENAWDGEWYRRAYFDDGTPLGSATSEECQIDSISQSWAVISGGGNPERIRKAMQAVDNRLVRRDAKLIQLLDPPFDKSDLEPGYIKGYVPGVRENGGQYTHAAIWATTAFAMLGDNDKTWELFNMLNPINHASQPEEIERYKVEPYVMCADIYGASPHTGRGGWTWYTGAAGWMYQLIVETILGIKLEVDHLQITPCIPAHWSSYKVHYRYRETTYHITIKNAEKVVAPLMNVMVDGIEVNNAMTKNKDDKWTTRIALIDDRQEHTIELTMK